MRYDHEIHCIIKQDECNNAEGYRVLSDTLLPRLF